MTYYFKFYKPQYNPTGLTSTVGGSIGSSELLPRKDTLFAHVDSSPTVAKTQYRKIWAKQVADVTLSGVRIELANVEQSSQIAFGIATGSYKNTTESNATTAPSGVSLTGTYLVPIYLTGQFNIDDTIAIWVKQTIAADTEDDDFVSLQLKIIGTIV